MRLLTLVVSSLVIAGCADHQADNGTASPAPAGQGDGSGRALEVRVPCGSSWFETHPDPADTIGVGRLIYDGEFLGYSERRRYGDYLAKAPLAIERRGSEAVTVRVRTKDEDGIALAYGRIEPTVPRDRAASEVTLHPCPDRPRTSFIGALLLDEPRSVVKLQVDLGADGTRILRLPSAPGGLPE